MSPFQRPEQMVDAPWQYLNMIRVDLPGNPGVVFHSTTLDINDVFQDFLMYLPPGGANSRWVPLEEQDWAWSASTSRVAAGNLFVYHLVGSEGPNPGGPQQPWPWEPMWDGVETGRCKGDIHHYCIFSDDPVRCRTCPEASEPRSAGWCIMCSIAATAG